MYFESQDTAEKVTATIAGTMVELNNRDPSLIGRQLSADVVSVELQATDTKAASTVSGESTEVSGGMSGSEGRGPGGVPGTNRSKNSRRKSLAEFQEINDAVGNALSEAADSNQGNANFDKAVGEQVETLLSTTLPDATSPLPIRSLH